MVIHPRHYIVFVNTVSNKFKSKFQIGSIFDREDDYSPKKSRNDKEKRQMERRREITRNRSMPGSTSSAEARKMFQSKLENNLNERR